MAPIIFLGGYRLRVEKVSQNLFQPANLLLSRMLCNRWPHRTVAWDRSWKATTDKDRLQTT
ncbi:MAG: hypothetical protein CK530_04480 [Planctomycetaceae bacterium]|nr:MAG: hypothetical protein CK530_07640 [Planctomycetaceae bacterium]PHY02784.1 MAG: hypothetical protein CK530_04480 [Planctomycetaceae bacterium]